MPVERSDIDLVMENFGCDEKTAVSLIENGINVTMLRDGVDSIVEPEIHLAEEARRVSEKLAEAVAEFKKDTQDL